MQGVIGNMSSYGSKKKHDGDRCCFFSFKREGGIFLAQPPASPAKAYNIMYFWDLGARGLVQGFSRCRGLSPASPATEHKMKGPPMGRRAKDNIVLVLADYASSLRMQ